MQWCNRCSRRQQLPTSTTMHHGTCEICGRRGLVQGIHSKDVVGWSEHKHYPLTLVSPETAWESVFLE